MNISSVFRLRNNMSMRNTDGELLRSASLSPGGIQSRGCPAQRDLLLLYVIRAESQDKVAGEGSARLRHKADSVVAGATPIQTAGRSPNPDDGASGGRVQNKAGGDARIGAHNRSREADRCVADIRNHHVLWGTRQSRLRGREAKRRRIGKVDNRQPA